MTQISVSAQQDSQISERPKFPSGLLVNKAEALSSSLRV